AVTFERGIFRSDKGDSEKAVAIRTLTESISDPAIFELCSFSRNPVFWLPITTNLLSTLEASQQIFWLKERIDFLTKLPDEAWRSLKPGVLQDQQLWDA